MTGPARVGCESLAGPQAAGPEVPPSVTVVIACLNAERWIARAIQSVFDQDYPHVALVVIDDGSTDRSLEFIKSFGARLTWETGPNSGAAHARNRGLELSTSEYVQFLDADDYLEGPLVSGLVRAALAKNADLTLGSTVIESTDGKRSARTGSACSMPNPEMVRAWLEGSYVQTGGMFWRREYLNRIGGWDRSDPRHDDVELALRALLDGARVAVAYGGVAVWCDHAGPARQSRRGEPGTWAATVVWLGRHGTLAASRHPGLELTFARELYALARRAFASGRHHAGVRALREARRLGLRGHPGSRRREILCRMVGMPLAEYVVIGARVSRSALKRLRRNLWKPSTAGSAPA
jgi:GT2 family glycosyltransferase